MMDLLRIGVSEPEMLTADSGVAGVPTAADADAVSDVWTWGPLTSKMESNPGWLPAEITMADCVSASRGMWIATEESGESTVADGVSGWPERRMRDSSTSNSKLRTSEIRHVVIPPTDSIVL